MPTTSSATKGRGRKREREREVYREGGREGRREGRKKGGSGREGERDVCLSDLDDFLLLFSVLFIINFIRCHGLYLFVFVCVFYCLENTFK
jgi:hypothetical protein